MVSSFKIPVFLKLFLIVQSSLITLNTDFAHSGTIDNQDMLMPLTPARNSVFIDLTERKKPDITLEKEAERKSLTDFGEFLQNTRNVYFTLWLVRIAQVNMLDNNRKEGR